MSDITIQLAVFVLGIVAFFSARKSTGVWLNPVSILVVCFFAPLFFSLFRLAGIQSSSWQYQTYVAIWAAIGAWLIFPPILLAARGKVKVLDGPLDGELLRTNEFRKMVRLFALVVVTAYYLGNYLQAGTPLPILNPEAAYSLHTVFPPVIRFFARANPAAVGLLFILYWAQRRKFDLFFLAFVFITPLSRLSRIDLALALVVILILHSVYPLIKVNAKRLLLLGVVFLALAIGGAELGNLRTNRFGVYEVKYENAIGWIPDVVGPASVFPIAYGYFPLSFENFDAFVRQFHGGYMLGFYSFDWLFTGFVKLNWVPGFAQLQSENAYFEPVSSAANVPTALFPFYADYGPVGMALPMMVYLIFWVYLFYRSRESAMFTLLFALYSGGFALASFQALIAASILVHQVVEVLLLFWVVKRLIRRKAANGRALVGA